MKKNITFMITRTAVMIAILVIVQFATKSLTQYVTGSLVNLILSVAALSLGLVEGLIVAVVSPFFASLFGIGPAFIQIVPFVALGNAVLVTVLWLFIGKEKEFKTKGMILGYAGAVTASLAKFATLWVGVTKISFLLIPEIKEAQIQKITAMFTWPQLVTALIGTIIALSVVPLLKKALKRGKN